MHFNVRFVGKTISKDEVKCLKIDAKNFSEASQITAPKSFKADLGLLSDVTEMCVLSPFCL